MLPNFLYAGTGKAGTTWLHATLQKHPGVYVTPVKETNYFDLNYDRGPDWYGSFFKDAQDGQAVGEIAHRYLRTPETAARIKDTLGDIPILVGLREPADYYLSDYLFTKRNDGTQESVTGYADHGFDWEAIDYPGLLQAYVDVFGAERILICDFAYLGRDPQGYLDQVTDFLGVARMPLTQETSAKVNPARAARSKTLAGLASSTSKWLKRQGGQRLIQAVKGNPMTQKLLYRDLAEKPVLPDALRARIKDHAAPGLAWVDDTFGAGLATSWYEGR